MHSNVASLPDIQELMVLKVEIFFILIIRLLVKNKQYVWLDYNLCLHICGVYFVSAEYMEQAKMILKLMCPCKRVVLV